MKLSPNCEIIKGDCSIVLDELQDNTIDSLVTDPPYGLIEYDANVLVRCINAWINGKRFMINGTGFMGQDWDKWIPGPEIWRKCLRVMKPGAFGLVFAGSRTFDLMTLALRLSGFEIKDVLLWIYGSAMPKGLDVGKQLLDWKGWNTALKPAFEPIILIQKPKEGSFVDNIKKWGVGALNVGECRISIGSEAPKQTLSHNTSASGRSLNRKNYDRFAYFSDTSKGRHPANLIFGYPEDTYQLKNDILPAELVIRNNHFQANQYPLSTVIDDAIYQALPSVVQNCYVLLPNPGKDEVLQDLPETTGGKMVHNITAGARVFGNKGARTNYVTTRSEDDPGGSVIRFFKRIIYQKKATNADRDEGGVKNLHPTVKPTDLMRYLIRLITPKNGITLDTFMGSGSTGKAALREDIRFYGIEQGEITTAQRRLMYEIRVGKDVFNGL